MERLEKLARSQRFSEQGLDDASDGLAHGFKLQLNADTAVYVLPRVEFEEQNYEACSGCR